MKKHCPFLLLFFFAACSDQQENRSILLQDRPTTDVTSRYEPVGVPADSIDNPEFLLSIDNYVILADPGADHTISVYNLETGGFQRTGRKGRAANEILNVNQIGIYPSTDTTAFYIHDNFAQKIFVYMLESGRCELWKIEEMPRFRTFDFDGHLTIGVNKGQDSRYLLTDSLSGAEVFFGDYSEYDLPMQQGALMYQGFCLVNPQQKRCAWFSFFGEACNMLDYGRVDEPRVFHNKTWQRVVIDQAADTPVMSPKTKIGFVSLTGSHERIFALCGDQTLQKFLTERTDFHLSHDICLFDWNGQYLERWISTPAVRCIGFNESRGELFALIVDQDLNYRVVSLAIDEIG